MRDIPPQNGMPFSADIRKVICRCIKERVETARLKDYGQRLDTPAQGKANTPKGLRPNQGDAVRTYGGIAGVSADLIEPSKLEFHFHSQARYDGLNEFNRTEVRLPLDE